MGMILRSRPVLIAAIVLSLLLPSCGQNGLGSSVDTTQSEAPIIDPNGKTLETRFSPPMGYTRIAVAENSFGAYLRNLPLKADGAKVLYYDGTEKNRDVYDAVVDLPIGKRDLHQCADAVMRLRAEWLYSEKRYEEIHFNFTNGFRVDYSEWMKGKRIAVEGNKTYWVQSAQASNTYKDFWNYMEIVFSYAGTLSLSKELKPIAVSEMQIGDVFIKGGSPGHAVIVVDMAEDTVNQKKVFLLAQSYMPAQETQILKNPNDDNTSPWYSLDLGEELTTPEWSFTSQQLMRFE
jgi:hypothetical protein